MAAALRITAVSNADAANSKLIKVPAGASLETLLKIAGEKLNIKARKVFIESGGEVEDPDLLRDNDVIFISAGEPFSPKKSAKDDTGLELFQIAVMGPGSVGKSAITLQFVQGVFVPEYDPTIEDAYRKNMVVDDLPCVLDILDTAGQEDYTALRSTWMRSRDGFVLVFSVVDRTTFDGLEAFYDQLTVMHEEKVPPLVIVGNKCDLDKREVTVEEGKRLAARYEGMYLETSAKTATGIEAVFTSVARGVRKHRAAGGRRQGEKPEGTGKKRWCVIL